MPEPVAPPVLALPPPLSAARPPRKADFEAVLQARAHLNGGGREEPCGPYALWTDLKAPLVLALCERLAVPLDDTFSKRFGLEPRGEPEEGVFLFDQAADFRAFARQRGRLRTGYAGFSDTSKGFVALYAEGLEADQLARTLSHELTHLVNRRALGPGLPPWLSEGLADAIGDAATQKGLGPLEGLRGVEGPAQRLKLAYGVGKVPSLERLASLQRDQFDGGLVSYDYEQSALFVRYLLLSKDLAPKFRDFLGRLAGAERYTPERLTESLGRSWQDLDTDLESWLAARS